MGGCMGNGMGGSMDGSMVGCGSSPQKALPPAPPPQPIKLDMTAEIQKFVEKYELTVENREQVTESLSKCGDRWPTDLNELDHSLSRARNPSSLLIARLREIEALRGLQQKAKSGHLPGCMCPACREKSFARAVGVNEGTAESASLNAAALAAYQGQQQYDTSGAPAEDDSFARRGPGGKGKSKAPLILPTGDLVDEVRTFAIRFALTERLSTKVMDVLQKRTDEQWRNEPSLSHAWRIWRK